VLRGTFEALIPLFSAQKGPEIFPSGQAYFPALYGMRTWKVVFRNAAVRKGDLMPQFGASDLFFIMHFSD